MHDRDAAAATLWQLKGLGVRIAIDDFGTGYSSLAYLRRFPIDMLKVAREFVDGLGRDANDDVITRAIVELANTLGLLTIAEGIETDAAVGDTWPRWAATSPRATCSRARSSADAASAVMAARRGRPLGAARAPAIEPPQAELASAAERAQAAGASPAASISARLLAAPRRPGVVALGLLPARGTPPSPAAPTPPPRSGRASGVPVNRPR